MGRNKGGHKCIGCGRRGNVGFFSIPNDPVERAIWLEKCGVHATTRVASTARVCKMHFTENDFVESSKGTRLKLKKSALPSVEVIVDKTDIRRIRNYKVSCYICGCLQYVENRSFHLVPYDTEIREKWLKNVGKVSDFNPIPQSVIRLCNLHFSPEDFIVHPWSKIGRLKRGAMPFVTSSNTTNYQNGLSASCNDHGEPDSIERDVAVVSCSSNVSCAVMLNDDKQKEESLKPKISKVTAHSEVVSASNTGDILGKEASNQMNNFSSKKKKALRRKGKQNSDRTQ